MSFVSMATLRSKRAGPRGSTGGVTTHYNAVLQVFSQPAGTRVTWTIDLLPDDKAAAVEAMQLKGLAVMKKTLES